MLYTILPLERIYSCRTECSEDFAKDKLHADTKYKRMALKHGHVYARREGEGFVVDGIISTEMSDYLNENYYPGHSIM